MTGTIHASWIIVRPAEGQCVRAARIQSVHRFADEFLVKLSV